MSHPPSSPANSELNKRMSVGTQCLAVSVQDRTAHKITGVDKRRYAERREQCTVIYQKTAELRDAYNGSWHDTITRKVHFKCHYSIMNVHVCGCVLGAQKLILFRRTNKLPRSPSNYTVYGDTNIIFSNYCKLKTHYLFLYLLFVIKNKYYI